MFCLQLRSFVRKLAHYLGISIRSLRRSTIIHSEQIQHYENLQVTSDKQEDILRNKDAMKAAVDDWLIAAHVVDRLCCLIFTILMIIVTSTFIVCAQI